MILFTMTTPASTRALVAAALLGTALWGLLEISGVLQSWQRLRQTQQESALIAQHLTQAHALALRNRAELEESVYAAAAPADRMAAMHTNMGSISKHWDLTQQFMRDRREGQLAATVSSLRWQYLQQGLLPTLAAMDEATGKQQVPHLASGALALFEPFGESLRALMHYETQRAERERTDAHHRLQSALWDFALLAGLLLMLIWALQRLLIQSRT